MIFYGTDTTIQFGNNGGFKGNVLHIPGAPELEFMLGYFRTNFDTGVNAPKRYWLKNRITAWTDLTYRWVIINLFRPGSFWLRKIAAQE